MLMQADSSCSEYYISQINQQSIQVKGTTFTNSIIVRNHDILPSWDITPRLNTLSIDDFQWLLQDPPDILLIGCGTTYQPLNIKLLKALHQYGIGTECMLTVSAARTYNLLLCDMRKVAAALVV